MDEKYKPVAEWEDEENRVINDLLLMGYIR